MSSSPTCPHFALAAAALLSPSSSTTTPPPLQPLAVFHSQFRTPQFQSQLRSNQLHCNACSTPHLSKDLWACLHCNPSAILCGRYTKSKHAVQHEVETSEPGKLGHILVMNVETREIYCYKCDTDVKDEFGGVNGGAGGSDRGGKKVREDAITPQMIRACLDENDDGNETDEVEANSPTSPSPPHSNVRNKKQTSSIPKAHPNNNNNNNNGGDNEDSDDSDSSSSSPPAKSVTYLDYYNNSKGGEVGLSNLGNTCFLSASLQALLHCPPLIAFFTPVNPSYANSESIKLKLVFDMSILLQKCWSGKFNICTPSDVVRDILHLYPYFRGYGHHDSQEALKYLLNNMHEAIQIVPQYDYCVTEKERLEKEKEDEEKKAEANKNGNISSKTLTSSNSVDLNSPTPASASTPSTSSSSSSSSAPAPKRYPDTSILTDIFQGSLESQVHCSNCHAVSIVYDPFWDLALDLPKDSKLKLITAERGHDGSVVSKNSSSHNGWFSSLCNYVGLTSVPLSLETCLHSFCTSDRLLNSDQYKCDKCKLKVDATKYLHINKLPEVLMLSLKRFTHNSYFGSKVNRTVTFPLNGLDMEPFLAKGSTEFGSGRKKDGNGSRSGSRSGSRRGSLKRPKDTLYDLFALVRHIGGTSGGHYISIAKNHNTSKWFEFDDRIVSEVSEDRVAKTEAYVLFYRRRRTGENVQQLVQHVKAAQILELPNPNPSVPPSSTSVPSNTSASVDSSASSSSSVSSSSSASSPPMRYISRHWWKKVTVFQRAEPIDNRDLVCVHGKQYGLPPDGGNVAIPVSIEGWAKLRSLLGGGPEIDGAKQECTICSLPVVRLREKRRISVLDTQASQQSNNSDPFYLIHDQWLRQWREFIADKGPRPGPISNQMLFETVTPATTDGAAAAGSGEMRLKKGLQKMNDYRGLHGLVFRELHKLYGGGPAIIRATMNIYDRTPITGVSEADGGPPTVNNQTTEEEQQEEDEEEEEEDEDEDEEEEPEPQVKKEQTKAKQQQQPVRRKEETPQKSQTQKNVPAPQQKQQQQQGTTEAETEEEP